MDLRKGVVAFAGNPVTLEGSEAITGKKAPDFTVLDNNLKEVKLSDYSSKVILISSFPSIDTGICSMQATQFNQEASSLGNNVQILTISCDLPFALKRYCADKGIQNALTLSDHRDLDFAYKYGFLMKELRLLARGNIVVDKEGFIRYVEYVPEITQHVNYEATLNAIKDCL